MSNVIVVIGAGSIGQAIARRVSAGKQVLLADLRQENADAAAKVLKDAGFSKSVPPSVDVSKRSQCPCARAESRVALGEVTGVIHAAGVSPTQASPETILAVDLYGTALVLEEFGQRHCPRRSRRRHRLAIRAIAWAALTAEQDKALATTPDGGTACPALAAAGPGEGLPARLPDLPSAATRCGSWRRPCAGASAARV